MSNLPCAKEIEADAGMNEEDSPRASGKPGSQNVSELMTDPELLAAIQSQLGPPKLSPEEFYKQLPQPFKRRVRALKKLQSEATHVEAEFYKEVHALEVKFASRYDSLAEKRAEIVTGIHEPTEEECDFPSDTEAGEEEEEESDKDIKEKAKVTPTGAGGDGVDETTKGIPGFWYTVFRNAEMISEMVMSTDEPVILKLRDIKVILHEDPMGFTLQFHFDSNPYFSNEVLTKKYEMSCEPDPEDVFSFGGPEIIKCTGCKIDWKSGKNLTVRTIQKKQKHKNGGATRTVVKTVRSDSFFNFFNPPQPSEDGEVDEDTQALLMADFEIGHFLRERLVPRAVLYYTGEILDEDSDEELDEEGEDEDEEEDEDDDEEMETGQGKPKRTSGNSKEQADCKQQ